VGTIPSGGTGSDGAINTIATTITTRLSSHIAAANLKAFAHKALLLLIKFLLCASIGDWANLWRRIAT
jgi:hypothetical protein